MFNRARLHLTLLYALLLGLTAVLIAGAIGILAVQEARHTDDRELQIRATAIGLAIPSGPPPSASAPRPQSRGADDHEPHLEQRGVLEYIMPVSGGQLLPPLTGNDLPGLPDIAAAEQVKQSGTARYTTISVQRSQVRVYSLPVRRNGGQLVGIVQVARSRYFVNSAIARLALISIGAALLGVLLSAGAAYWLAGRTLRPIAVALARQRDFAADASHELRTPLTVMLTNAELLTLHPEWPLSSYQDVVADIIAEIERLSRMVTDLLTLARADQGKAALTVNEVDLSGLALTVARQFTSVAATKGVDLRTEIEPDVLVAGDQDRLHQLVVILIDNAVRYTAAGSVELGVRLQGHEGVIRVTDTGPGIAPQHLPHLFERFYRTDAARSAEEGGTGLGLALAQWITESHHGRIEVSSSLGQGSTFTVYLPARRATDGRARPGQPHSAAATEESTLA